MKFCYWDVRGLGEMCRLMFRYVGANYEDVKLSVENRDDWFKQKFTLGLDFPNLPYLIDGDVKLTQVCVTTVILICVKIFCTAKVLPNLIIYFYEVNFYRFTSKLI